MHHPLPNLVRASTQPNLQLRSDPPSDARLNNDNHNISINSHEDEHLPPVRLLHQFSNNQYPAQSMQNIHFTRELARCPPLVSFRQESLRGSRILRIPSETDMARTTRIQQVPNNNEAVIIPIENIPEENLESYQTRESVATNDRQVEGSEQQQEEVNQDQAITKAASYRVIIQLFFNLFMLVSYGLGYLYLKGDISLQAILGVALGMIALYVIALVKTKGFASSEEEYDKVDIILSVANSFALALYAVAILLKLEGTDMILYPISLFGVFVLFCACCKSSVNTPSPTEVLLLMAKCVVWVELFLIGLRVDGLDVPWGTVFIPLYFALMILAFSSILIIFGSLFAFFSIMKDEGVSAKLVVGSVWYVLNTFYTAIWLAVATELVEQLDENDGDVERALQFSLGHSAILVVYNLIFWKLLCKFQEFEIQSEMLGMSEEEDSMAQGPNADQNTQIRFQVNKEDKTNLVMISPTFFSYFRKQHKNTKNDKQLETLKSEVEKVKNEKYKHVLSLNMPYASEQALPKALSPTAKKPKHQILDFSEGDIDIRKTLPVPALKRGESAQSSENLCTICYDSAPNGVYMDCGHGGVCYECALETWKKSENCILCRQRISKVLKIVVCKPLGIVKVVESTTKVVGNV